MTLNISTITSDEVRPILDKLVAFNGSQVPYIRNPVFERLNFGIKDGAGNIVAATSALLDGWKCLTVDLLWTDEAVRKNGLGTQLMDILEETARRRGATLAHLDTFDFQAKEFYERRGYDVFGVLDDCPVGHNRYFMKKTL